MMKNTSRKKFQAKARVLAAAKKKDRFVHVVGKLKRAKLLDAPDIREYGGPVGIEDALWAGTIEPRILEVLPALIATRPKYLRLYRVPEDLKRVVAEIHAGNAHQEFRGIPPKDYCKWLPQGRYGASRLKTFRMHQSEIQLLKKLRLTLGVRSETEVLRQALSLLGRATAGAPKPKV